MAFFPLVLVRAAELFECVRHLRDGKRAGAETESQSVGNTSAVQQQEGS